MKLYFSLLSHLIVTKFAHDFPASPEHKKLEIEFIFSSNGCKEEKYSEENKEVSSKNQSHSSVCDLNILSQHWNYYASRDD